MNNKIIIAIDAMGAENAPAKNIEGILLFLKKIATPSIFLVGAFSPPIASIAIIILLFMIKIE